jgi:sorting nexin-1/2
MLHVYSFNQWESKVQRCQKEFEDISAEIKREVERFELNRAKDFKTTIVKYLQDQMAHQQQVINYFSLLS